MHLPPHAVDCLPSPLLACATDTSGEAAAIYKRAEATAKGIQLLADAIKQQGGNEAVALKVGGAGACRTLVMLALGMSVHVLSCVSRSLALIYQPLAASN